jgi:hypothetical protein
MRFAALLLPALRAPDVFAFPALAAQYRILRVSY